jgi:hypothetical protein
LRSVFAAGQLGGDIVFQGSGSFLAATLGSVLLVAFALVIGRYGLASVSIGLLLMCNQPPVKLFVHEVGEQQIVIAVVAISNRQHWMAVWCHLFVNQDSTGKHPRCQIETTEQTPQPFCL